MYTDSTGYSLKSWVKETWDTTSSAVVNVWNCMMYLKVLELEEKRYALSLLGDLTVSIGTYVTGSLFLTGTDNLILSCDTKGNIGLQSILSAGITPSIRPSLVVGFNLMITGAKSILGLNGYGGTFGGAVGFIDPFSSLGVGAGAEIVTNFDYVGSNLYAGLGFHPGPEIHLEGSYTETIYYINLFDIKRRIFEGWIIHE
jgi:hypothetical protein